MAPKGKYDDLLAQVITADADDAAKRVDEARESLKGFTPEQVDALDALLAIGNPAKVAQAAYAATLNVNDKSFRSRVRTTRSVSVSKRAAGCKRDEMDVTDLVWSVATFSK